MLKLCVFVWPTSEQFFQFEQRLSVLFWLWVDFFEQPFTIATTAAADKWEIFDFKGLPLNASPVKTNEKIGSEFNEQEFYHTYAIFKLSVEMINVNWAEAE